MPVNTTIKSSKIRYKLALSAMLICFSTNSIAECDKNCLNEDPFEPLNRITYAINKEIDRFLIKPVSAFYDTFTPKPIKLVVVNFYRNIRTLPIIVNNLLQQDYQSAIHNSTRFVTNSTIGFFGAVDIADSVLGLEFKTNGFGITLGKWGAVNSPYFVIPILGPSTLRDVVGIGVDMFMYPPSYVHPVKERNLLYGLDMLRIRTEYLETDPIVDAAGVDEYALVKNAYLQSRNYLITGDLADSELESEADIDSLLMEPPA